MTYSIKIYSFLQMSPEWLSLIHAITDIQELMEIASLMGMDEEPEIIERINQLSNSPTPSTQQDCDHGSLLDEIVSYPLVGEVIACSVIIDILKKRYGYYSCS